MIAPAVVERACCWSVDTSGRPVCTVRRDLKRAVEGWTGAARVVRDPSKRAVAEDRRKRAIRELAAHSCGPVEASLAGGPTASPAASIGPSAGNAANPRTPHEQQGISGSAEDGLGAPAHAVADTRTSAGPVSLTAGEVRKGEDAPRSPDGGSWSARGSHPNAERSAPTPAVRPGSWVTLYDLIEAHGKAYHELMMAVPSTKAAYDKAVADENAACERLAVAIRDYADARVRARTPNPNGGHDV
jgi:hypothetical protein